MRVIVTRHKNVAYTSSDRELRNVVNAFDACVTAENEVFRKLIKRKRVAYLIRSCVASEYLLGNRELTSRIGCCNNVVKRTLDDACEGGKTALLIFVRRYYIVKHKITYGINGAAKACG